MRTIEIQVREGTYHIETYTRPINGLVDSDFEEVGKKSITGALFTEGTQIKVAVGKGRNIVYVISKGALKPNGEVHEMQPGTTIEKRMRSEDDPWYYEPAGLAQVLKERGSALLFN